jgi:hypothetical protein
MSFIFIKKTDMSEVRNHLETRFANPIPGTRGFHYFIPENESMISACTVSSDNESFYHGKKRESQNTYCISSYYVETPIIWQEQMYVKQFYSP